MKNTSSRNSSHHGDHPADSRQKGFTLIEIVIAMALLAWVLGTSYEIFSNCIDTERKVIEITVPEKVGEGILTLMRRDLAGAVFKGCTEQLENQVFDGRSEGSDDQRADSVFFVSTVDPTPGGEFMEWDNLRTLTVVGYLLKQNDVSSKYPTYTLYRKEMIDFAKRDITNAPGLNYSIYDKVKSLKIQYFDGYNWWDEWDSRANIEEMLIRQQEENNLAGTQSNIPRVTGAVAAEEEGLAGELEQQAAAIPVAVRIELQIYSGSGNEILEKGKNNNRNPVVNTFTTMVPLLASRRIAIPIEDEDLAAAGGTGAGGAGEAGADGAVNTFGADLTKEGRGKGRGKGSLRDRLTERGGRGASGRGQNPGGRNPAPGVRERAMNALKGAGGASGATRSFGKGSPR
ncbi:MAG: prepilin-type N-terminal cleavage/methylation domain-containing protein [Planctomycetota bacterium]|nr:prepilin-type N-terminal cleavage/methylation domain-containing protein [Planctomycetota bacterium]